ncbi:hypothetical protein C1645_842205 [Glomus cerebriforme]|uniref:SAM domain-containing protein n=1 Tax=Glomus cerebriforme TaxID=658196 RepID=A0A397S7Z5_9GLOM|nr:hypothetical protein C1645_842205 [Glomus cerebriforme]
MHNVTNAYPLALMPLQIFTIYPIHVEEFLKKLDKDEGDNGDFTQFINAFIKQKITVKHIKDLNDNDFQVLGIKTKDYWLA